MTLASGSIRPSPTEQENERRLAASEERQSKVIELYIKHGYSIRQVAEQLGVGKTTIAKDIIRARRTWAKQIAENYDNLAMAKVIELNEIRKSAWEGWKKSIEAGEPDPRFLKILQDNIGHEAKLLGMLDEEQPTIGNDAIPVVNVVISSREEKEEFDRTFTLDRLKAAAGLPAPAASE